MTTKQTPPNGDERCFDEREVEVLRAMATYWAQEAILAPVDLPEVGGVFQKLGVPREIQEAIRFRTPRQPNLG